MSSTTTRPTTTARTTPRTADAGQFGRLLPAALAYAARGWHVFPLRFGTKKPATPNHPVDRCDHTDPRCQDGHTGWEARATTDPERITRAWSTHPYGIGVACGPSGLVVVDLDTPKPGTTLPREWHEAGAVGGADVYAALADRHSDDDPGLRATTYTVRTPTGGTHLYYTHPAGVRLGNTASSVGPMVDTRAHGGYVVAPPTTTPTGNYRVTVDVDPAPLPAWLATTLTPQRPRTISPITRPTPGTTSGRSVRYATAALTHELRRVTHAAHGNRNHSLFTAALALGQIVGAGALTGPDVTTALLDACAGHIDAGAFTTGEATATIASGLRRGTAEPRTLTGTAA